MIVPVFIIIYLSYTIIDKIIKGYCQLFVKYRIYFEIDIKYVKTAHLLFQDKLLFF